MGERGYDQRRRDIVAIETERSTDDFEAFIERAGRQHLRVSRPEPGAEQNRDPNPGIRPHIWKWSTIEKLLPSWACSEVSAGPTKMCDGRSA
jgi:gentisate 1,2-dioxygenase